MARLFSITIPFKNKQYTALVSLKEQGHDLCCFVRYIDKQLRYILPGDQLIFSLQEGLKQPKHLPDELAESLVISTTNAIAQHLGVED